jgi:hypothetical protein
MIEQERIASQERAAMKAIDSKEELEGMRLGIDVKRDQSERNSREQMEGMRMGIDVAKSKGKAPTE